MSSSSPAAAAAARRRPFCSPCRAPCPTAATSPARSSRWLDAEEAGGANVGKGRPRADAPLDSTMISKEHDDHVGRDLAVDDFGAVVAHRGDEARGGAHARDRHLRPLRRSRAVPGVRDRDRALLGRRQIGERARLHVAHPAAQRAHEERQEGRNRERRHELDLERRPRAQRRFERVGRRQRRRRHQLRDERIWRRRRDGVALELDDAGAGGAAVGRWAYAPMVRHCVS